MPQQQLDYARPSLNAWTWDDFPFAAIATTFFVLAGIDVVLVCIGAFGDPMADVGVLLCLWPWSHGGVALLAVLITYIIDCTSGWARAVVYLTSAIVLLVASSAILFGMLCLVAKSY